MRGFLLNVFVMTIQALSPRNGGGGKWGAMSIQQHLCSLLTGTYTLTVWYF